MVPIHSNQYLACGILNQMKCPNMFQGEPMSSSLQFSNLHGIHNIKAQSIYETICHVSTTN